MKKIITIICISLSFVVNAQSKKFIKSMEKNIASMDTCKTQSSFQKLANSFERIGNAEKKEWLPFYYSAYSYILIG